MASIKNAHPSQECCWCSLQRDGIGRPPDWATLIAFSIMCHLADTTNAVQQKHEATNRL